MPKNPEAEAKKGLGNDAFKKGDYAGAVSFYTEAIEIDATNHVYYSNRSMCLEKQGKNEEALADGAKCISIDPKFVKGYFRKAAAEENLGQYIDALKTLQAGQKVAWDNSDLKKKIQAVEPLAEQEKQDARRGLPKDALEKEKGNDAFKNAQYDKAIEHYTKALNITSDKTSALAISCFNNRAACNQQMSNFQAVIEDTSEVIEVDPRNLKALLRRGLAFEGLERYKSALQDIRAVLAIDPKVDVANKAQHRIGSAVRQLKKAGF